MCAYTIQDDVDTVNLGRVQSDSSSKSGTTTQLPLPETDSSGALLIPLLGPIRKFNPTLKKTGTLSELKTFIAKLDKWVLDGHSLSKANITYNSDLENATVSGRVMNYQKTWNAGKPTILNYSIEIVEGIFI